jgi:hypothetical protein
MQPVLFYDGFITFPNHNWLQMALSPLFELESSGITYERAEDQKHNNNNNSMIYKIDGNLIALRALNSPS